MILSLTLSTSSDLFNRSKPIVTLERTLEPGREGMHLAELIVSAALAAGLTAPEPDPSDPDTCEEGERTSFLRRIREHELTILDLRERLEQVGTERDETTKGATIALREAGERISELETELDKVAGETEARVREELAEEVTPIGKPPLANLFPHGTILEQSPRMRWIVLLDQDQAKRFHYIGNAPDDSSFPHTALGAGPWKVTRP